MSGDTHLTEKVTATAAMCWQSGHQALVQSAEDDRMQLFNASLVMRVRPITGEEASSGSSKFRRSISGSGSGSGAGGVGGFSSSS